MLVDNTGSGLRRAVLVAADGGAGAAAGSSSRSGPRASPVTSAGADWPTATPRSRVFLRVGEDDAVTPPGATLRGGERPGRRTRGGGLRRAVRRRSSTSPPRRSDCSAPGAAWRSRSQRSTSVPGSLRSSPPLVREGARPRLQQRSGWPFSCGRRATSCSPIPSTRPSRWCRSSPCSCSRGRRPTGIAGRCHGWWRSARSVSKRICPTRSRLFRSCSVQWALSRGTPVENDRWRTIVVRCVPIGVVLWFQPLLEQVLHGSDGNLSRLVGATGHLERSLGVVEGTKRAASVIVLPPAWWRGGSADYSIFERRPSTLAAFVALLALLALLVTLAIARRRRFGSDAAATLLASAAAFVVVGWLATIRLPLSPHFGFSPNYVRWLWPIAAFCVVAILTAVGRAVYETSMLHPRVIATAAVLILGLAVTAVIPAGPGTAASQRLAGLRTAATAAQRRRSREVAIIWCRVRSQRNCVPGRLSPARRDAGGRGCVLSR